jgi:hypothetical protein
MKPVSVVVHLILVAVGVGCSGSTAPQHTGSVSSASTVVACTIPASVAVSGDGSTGCYAQPVEQNCTVTGGATVNSDGTVTNGTATCTSACAPHRYYLACDGPLGTVGSAPSPDPSLDCKPAGGPTASNEAAYCCTCDP